MALHPAEAGYNEGFERKRAAHWEAPDKQPANGWAPSPHRTQSWPSF